MPGRNRLAHHGRADESASARDQDFHKITTGCREGTMGELKAAESGAQALRLKSIERRLSRAPLSHTLYPWKKPDYI
jgi:hypothetical protein